MSIFSIQDEVEDLVEEFDLFDDWEQCYKYFIDMGKVFVFFDLFEKNDIIKVKGCVSQVWLMYESDNDIYIFCVESDVYIVKGFVVLLVCLYFGCIGEDIFFIDVCEVLQCIGLVEYLLL